MHKVRRRCAAFEWAFVGTSQPSNHLPIGSDSLLLQCRTYLGCRLTHAYQHYLFLPNQPTYAAIKNAAVMAMINLPAMTVNMFQPERTLAAVLDVLQTQLHMAPPDDLCVHRGGGI